MKRMEPDKALDGPEFEVWNHLYSGLVLARMELDCLSEKERIALTKLGEQIFLLKANLIAAEDDILADVSQLLLKKLLSYSAIFSDGTFNHGDTNHIFSGLGEDFKIFGQASKSAQPSKRSFDNPAFGNHLESVRRFSGDIDA